MPARLILHEINIGRKATAMENGLKAHLDSNISMILDAFLLNGLISLPKISDVFTGQAIKRSATATSYILYKNRTHERFIVHVLIT